MLATQAKERVDEPRHALSNEPPHRIANAKSFSFGAPRCRIYQPSASVMQSGGRTRRKWLLEFESASPRWIEPLMGWTASNDPFASVRLTFATRSAAIDYAERHGLDYEVIDPPARRLARPLSIARGADQVDASICNRPNPWLAFTTQTQPEQHAWRYAERHGYDYRIEPPARNQSSTRQSSRRTVPRSWLARLAANGRRGEMP
jgi:NADH dehydrogenase